MSGREFKTFSDILSFVKSCERQKVAIACAADEAVLKAADIAFSEGILDSMLFGAASKIKKVADSLKIDIEKFTIIDIASDKEAAEAAVTSVKNGDAHILMKGHMPTSLFLKSVLNRENGLRRAKILSHVQVFECPITGRIRMLSDGGMNLAPKEEELNCIAHNAITAFYEICGRSPNVAMISAYNQPDGRLAASVFMPQIAAELLSGTAYGTIDISGPMTLDVAVSKSAASKKNFTGRGAGNADVFILPNIETGNLFGKCLTYFAKAPSAGLIIGAARPIIMLSRADDHSTKLNSMSIGCIMALKERNLIK